MVDFQEFYGLNLEDIWTGALSVRRALIYTWGLDQNPRSRFRASRLGGYDHLGWSKDTYLAADTRDGVVALLMSLGGNPAEFVPAARPEPIDNTPDDGGTIADFNVGEFFRKLAT